MSQVPHIAMFCQELPSSGSGSAGDTVSHWKICTFGILGYLDIFCRCLSTCFPWLLDFSQTPTIRLVLFDFVTTIVRFSV